MTFYKELGKKLGECHEFYEQKVLGIEQLLENIKTEELDANNTHPVTNKIVYEAIEALKKSVSDGKKMIANAITSKGIDTAINESFQAMAVNIYNIGRQEIGIDIFYFPIDVEDSTTVPHVYDNVNVAPVYGDYVDVLLTSIYTYHIATEEALIIPWSNRSVAISNEREEY